MTIALLGTANERGAAIAAAGRNRGWRVFGADERLCKRCARFAEYFQSEPVDASELDGILE